MFNGGSAVNNFRQAALDGMECAAPIFLALVLRATLRCQAAAAEGRGTDGRLRRCGAGALASGEPFSATR